VTSQHPGRKRPEPINSARSNTSLPAPRALSPRIQSFAPPILTITVPHPY
jgi:hypothetical protein